jgi:hypothetical protein
MVAAHGLRRHVLALAQRRDGRPRERHLGNGWGNGDTTEGRVAGALIDLTDLTNEAPWDRYGEGASAIWRTFTCDVSNTLAAFWMHRSADGFPVAYTQPAELFQSTGRRRSLCTTRDTGPRRRTGLSQRSGPRPAPITTYRSMTIGLRRRTLAPAPMAAQRSTSSRLTVKDASMKSRGRRRGV